MIEPGNMRERPRGLDRAALGYQFTDDLHDMVVETMRVRSLVLSRYTFENWDGVDLPQLKERCAIVRQELDIMNRLLKLPDKHEIHDSH